MLCYKFPGYTCISVNHAAAHGIPDDTVLQDGDLINIDVSAEKNGFFGDNGESFVVGTGHQTKMGLVKSIHEAHKIALNAAKAGCPINAIGKAVEKYAISKNLTVIRNLGGHGIGHSLHEQPEFVGSFDNPRDKRVFQKNQVVAIEPFLSNGSTEMLEGADGWTLFDPCHYTVQKEHTIMIRKGKPHIFTQPTQHFAS
jgi:methionyl aminopeptidase